MSSENFEKSIKEGYTFKGDYITIGSCIYDNQVVADCPVNIPLKTLNRHGLIAGATGTGKTKTIQVLSEQLSGKGIPVLMMDIKGDFSGIAEAGAINDFIKERHDKMNLPFDPKGFPVELLTISKQNGIRLRATVSEFGPVLLSRILDLNDTQGGVLAVAFKYCDDHKIPLLDIKDLKKVLNYLTNEGKNEIEADYGRLSTSTTGAILRKIVELEQQDANLFFGEVSFDIHDLMRIDENGNGYVNILRLTDIQDKPKLFSTFMLCLLAEIYNQMPELGDSGQPELVIFIDEAHLIFKEASKALLDQIETIVKLIRSKGIGIYFITQNPTDVPNGVLAQLGLKIQHALRAFTEKDRKAIKTASENFPATAFYKTDEVITQLGTGEALITVLNEKGIPTPLVVGMMRAPVSRMDVLSPSEIDTIISHSSLKDKYNEVVDRDSAYEILNRKLAESATVSDNDKKTGPSKPAAPAKETDYMKPIIKVLTSATFIRGAFGVLTKLFKNTKSVK